MVVHTSFPPNLDISSVQFAFRASIAKRKGAGVLMLDTEEWSGIVCDLLGKTERYIWHGRPIGFV